MTRLKDPEAVCKIAKKSLFENNTAIPASQVVRTTARGGTGGAAPAITAANVPPIAATPAAADTITFATNLMVVPD